MSSNIDDEEPTSTEKSADLKNKEDIIKYVENQELSLKKQEQLENSMCLVFVCASVLFNIAGNEIFHAWLQNLRPGFNIPSSRTLAERIFNKQIIKLTLEDVLTIADKAEKLNDNNSDKGSIKNDKIEFELLDELLKLEETFDLNYEIFTEKGQSNSIESNSKNVVEEQPNYDYNVDNLVDKMFAK
ncbi:3753_t:CDS:2 [Cetraspora pellucida]|uniref:3753_t:CDS:1 n=1 Tax=Cetraspora pellucida TaxID=1433469 RepID=A0A9N9DU97_9GLOM|nr:3753_t:CDS:2 [Cetraspora pellucida]